MYPLSLIELTLHELVEHWLKQRSDGVSFSDLLSALLTGFWCGELPLRASPHSEPWHRRALLDAVRNGTPPDHGGMIFRLPSATIPTTIETADGGIIVDLLPKVTLGADPSSWSEAELEEAYAVLAACRCNHYAPLVLPGLLMQLVHRDDFAHWCDRRRWARPKFWFRTEWPSQGARAKTSAVCGCRRWLIQVISRGDVPPKPVLRDQALRDFPGLTGRAFDAIWTEVASAELKAPGRRRGR